MFCPELDAILNQENTPVIPQGDIFTEVISELRLGTPMLPRELNDLEPASVPSKAVPCRCDTICFLDRRLFQSVHDSTW